MKLPPRLPVRGREAKLLDWLNQLRDAVAALTPVPAPGALLARTAIGTSSRPTASGAISRVAMNWCGEWDAGASYVPGDMVIRGSANVGSAARNSTDLILTDGKQGGTFICKVNAPSGTAAPGEPNATSFWETLSRGAWHILNVTAAAKGSILLRAEDAKSSTGVYKGLSVREENICESGRTRKKLFVTSETYD